MQKVIKVRATENMRVYQHDRKTLACEVDEGEEITAELHEPSEEYFGNNRRGQEVYVGCLRLDGSLELEDEFELISL